MVKFCIFWLRGSNALITLVNLLQDNPIIDDKILYGWCRYDKLVPDRNGKTELDLFIELHDTSYFTYDLDYELSKKDADEFSQRYCRYEIQREFYRYNATDRKPVGVTKDENFYIRDCEAETLFEFINTHLNRVPLKFLSPKMRVLLYSVGYLDVFCDEDYEDENFQLIYQNRWLAHVKKYADAYNWGDEVALLSVIFCPLIYDLNPNMEMKIDPDTFLWKRKKVH